MLSGVHPLTTFNFNEETIMWSLELRRVCHRRESSSCYRLFLAFIPLLPLKTSRHVAHLFSSSLQQCWFFIIVDPLLHFSLCLSDSLSVCTLPTSSTYHMNLPRPPCPTPPPPPYSLAPLPPLRPSSSPWMSSRHTRRLPPCLARWQCWSLRR